MLAFWRRAPATNHQHSDWTSWRNFLPERFPWLFVQQLFLFNMVTFLRWIKSNKFLVMKDGRARYWLSYGVTDNASDVFQSTDTFRKLCISSSLWSWWSCAYALILCVTDICLMYFNCVCFTVIFLGKIASLSVLLQTFSGMHPWWILRLYIAFGLHWDVFCSCWSLGFIFLS